MRFAWRGGGQKLGTFNLESRLNECLVDLGSWRLNVVFHGVWKFLGGLEAGRDECLEDPGSGRLNVSYSMVSGGSWEVLWLDLTNVSRILGGW